MLFNFQKWKINNALEILKKINNSDIVSILSFLTVSAIPHLQGMDET